jgi:hypothetical protein
MGQIDTAIERLAKREVDVTNMQDQFKFVLQELAKSSNATVAALLDKMRTEPTLNKVNGDSKFAGPVTRFLLIGPQAKDLEHIRQKLPRGLTAELNHAPNTDRQNFPANMHYCLISGHNDFTKVWQACRSHYGESKVFRLQNGADGTFAHYIEQLCRDRLASL